ncbi:GvpL/GvpF family gas vesicle protein [Ectothiorhodospira shaposhnikovii]|uniref:GvpL/GvpF family gas vesicle protein n=1 Tax=Ectothiorhodospira shaposhnikovii TaxID=1054 RepID=UPI001EE93940|nr:GvpL/GvpF family gas vesicle protein [Ectothiorhodospira shaposhnikovii]MCG5514358.1 GvpL/GvpF family gas vesicle protein [Ectothiorhodospira shaposhnikovii]
MTEALYLYCLARGGSIHADALPAPSAWASEGDRVPVLLECLEHEGIVALYGRVDADQFSDENLQSLAWLGPRAVAHARTVQDIMALGPVLPVKFGTLFQSPDSLRAFLAGHHAAIEGQFQRLNNKSEWSIKGFMDAACVQDRIKAEDPDIRARIRALPESPGKRYLLMKKLDTIIAGQARQQMEDFGREIVAQLAHMAEEAAPLSLHGREAAGRDEPMVFNHSFLVDTDCSDAFQSQALALADQVRTEGLILVVQGPWPPYNYCRELTDTAAGT